MFADNTVIRDPESCSRSITCLDGKSTYSTCTGSKPFFDKSKLSCVSSLAEDEADGCYVSCVNATNTWIGDPKSCFGYYYCIDEQTPAYGTCPDDMHFNSAIQECVWTHTSDCHSTKFDYCSIIKDGVKFDNVLGCDRYHVCTKGVLVDSSCSSGYFQKRTGACEPKTSVYCDAHPFPKNVCGTEKSPKKNALVPDGATCHGHFFCAEQDDGTPDPNPRWGRCNDDLFFDKSSQKCVEPNKVVCTEDRCQGRTIPFVLSSTKGCRHYLRCGNGRTIDEKSCGNYFFDEANEMCVDRILTYAIC
ncbi:GH11417 [Drosophila grimshawi]|uniref:GH11417 n=2 Tax=Drosophila grimshawi TaxID=7222 RepID=B4JA95_DROGR|nr:GH11417 [Drosophila grimshawi]